MDRGSTITGAALSLAVASAIVTAPPAHGVTAYVNADEWLIATGSLGPVMLVPLTLTAPVFSDAWGTFTDLNEKVDVPEGPQPGGGVGWNEGGERPRSVFLTGHGPPPSSSSGGLFALGPSDVAATFGCYTAVYPCLGVQTFEAAFDQPILGFGGLFSWYVGYGDFEYPVDVNGFTLTWDTLPLKDESFRNHQGFLGFIGPMDTLSIHWLGGNADDSARVHWAAPFAIVAVAVPEPSTLAVLAGSALGLFGLAALGPPVRGPTRQRRHRPPSI
ncbi:hypothetical protein [Elioraea sp.]|uniref:hypothetical protein n=1 Tax=Elioraea sp. TaxID=2185103 RepID=UPI003F70E3B3